MTTSRPRSVRRLCMLGAVALASVSVACHLDMLLKTKNPPRPALSISPAEVRDSARAGSRDVREADVEITNDGEGSLQWTASDHSSWIHLDPTEGDVPGTLTIRLDPENLDPGVYEGDVTVMATAAGVADTQLTTIPVTFLVTRPGLNVSPMTIERSTKVGSNESFTETIQVTNNGTGQLTWSADEDKSWLSLGTSSGTGNGAIPVTINSTGLGGGTYHGTITVTAPGATGSPARVSVTLNVLAPGLAVSPGQIHETSPVGSTIPKTTTLHVTNSGNGTVTWTAAKTQLWLSVAPATGTAPPAADVTVTLDPNGLPPGIYRDTVVFSAPEATNGPVLVPVEFEIAQPGLSVAPPSITATADQNDGRKQFDLSITNSAGGTLGWLASSDQPWISLSALGGLAPSTLTVTLDPRGLPAGTQTGTVTVASPGAAGSPFAVPVQFTITKKSCNETAITPDVVRNGTLDANDCDAPHRPGSHANLYGLTLNAGDTLSIRLAAQFDAYLIFTDGAGNVLAQNDECPGESGTACIMNFPIATGGHYLIEATSTSPGASGQLTITVVRERAPTAPQGLGQFRGNGNTAIAVGDATPENQVVIKGKVDDPNDIQQVRLEIELEPMGSPFTGVATHVGDFVSAGGGGSQTSVQVTGLTNNTGYRWRARTCDNTGRCSAWLEFGDNADSAMDFKVVIQP